MPQEFYAEDLTGDAVNPYEAVVAVSAEARRINQTRLMVDQPEGEEKVTTIAMRRLAERKLRIIRIEESAGDADELADEAPPEQTDSAGD